MRILRVLNSPLSVTPHSHISYWNKYICRFSGVRSDPIIKRVYEKLQDLTIIDTRKIIDLDIYVTVSPELPVASPALE